LKLSLLDIDKFIKNKKLKKVTSSKYYTSTRKFDPHGLFSEEIFDPVGSRTRKTKFGYLDLGSKFIHPEVYFILTSINPDLTKLINNRGKYEITKDGLIISNNEGQSGSLFFIENINKIDWDKIKTEKKENIKYIKKRLNKILIDKYLILPAGLRDIIIKKNKTQIQYSEINIAYTRLINYTNILSTNQDNDLIDPNLNNDIYYKIEKLLIDINKQLKGLLKGKYGIIRGGILKKVVDYSARLVIVPDLTLQIGEVGLSWHVLLKLFEPFFIHYVFYKDSDKILLKQIQEYLSINDTNEINNNTISLFINKVYEEPESINPMFKDILIQTIKKIVDGKQVLYKRDPVENRESYISADVVVFDTNNVLRINPLNCNRTGADFDGDTLAVYSILTNEAIKQAKENLNPQNTKSQLYSSVDQTINYSLEHDAVIAVYNATSN